MFLCRFGLKLVRGSVNTPERVQLICTLKPEDMSGVLAERVAVIFLHWNRDVHQKENTTAEKEGGLEERRVLSDDAGLNVFRCEKGLKSVRFELSSLSECSSKNDYGTFSPLSVKKRINCHIFERNLF